MFVLDTDILSNLRKKRAHPNLVRWLDALPPEDLATTAITIMEIQVGIERARRSKQQTAEAVQAWLDGLLAVGHPQVLPLDADAAVILGRMRETPALRRFVAPDPRRKQVSTDANLAIAAIAIARERVIVTNNARDFQVIDAAFPLQGVFNPFDEIWLIDRTVPAEPDRN